MNENESAIRHISMEMMTREPRISRRREDIESEIAKLYIRIHVEIKYFVSFSDAENRHT